MDLIIHPARNHNGFKLLLCVLLFFTSSNPLFSRNPVVDGRTAPVFFREERLTYEVSWMSIKIGTITLSVQQQDSDDVFLSTAQIDSYDGLPFADVHAIFQGRMNSRGQTLAFTGYDKVASDKWSVVRYEYQNSNAQTIILRGNVRDPNETAMRLHPMDTIGSIPPTHDGLSIFYFARQHAHSQDTVSVQTIVQGNSGSTLLNFHGKRSQVRAPISPVPIPVIEVDGEARFKGVFGLTGEFKGWFSDDQARVPVRATLGVILGSVQLDLIRWKRSGWSVPQ